MILTHYVCLIHCVDMLMQFSQKLNFMLIYHIQEEWNILKTFYMRKSNITTYTTKPKIS